MSSSSSVSSGDRGRRVQQPPTQPRACQSRSGQTLSFVLMRAHSAPGFVLHAELSKLPSNPFHFSDFFSASKQTDRARARRRARISASRRARAR